MNAPLPAYGHRGVGIDALAVHPERIDVRTPAEFEIDHVPTATNAPVLSNEERARVGTLHATDGAFAAKKVGAALISRNIAGLLESFADRPREWAPLVYCWRGGQRSRSLVHVMNEIGWRAVFLQGGYRTWRRHVVAELERMPAAFRYRVVCGLTGSGKSRLLAALESEGAQVLDLEGLARHRGSLLGDVPGDPQPSQKRFESELYAALSQLDRTHPVFVESESRRIGRVQLPNALMDAMRRASCIRIEPPRTLRVALLQDEYAHFLANPTLLTEHLQPLVPLLGHKTIERWSAAAAASDFDTLVGELLAEHYDPRYARSIDIHFPNHADAVVVAPEGMGTENFRSLARSLLAENEPETIETWQ